MVFALFFITPSYKLQIEGVCKMSVYPDLDPDIEHPLYTYNTLYGVGLTCLLFYDGTFQNHFMKKFKNQKEVFGIFFSRWVRRPNQKFVIKIWLLVTSKFLISDILDKSL